MLRKLAVLVSVMLVASFAFGQTGTIKGKMLDKDNDEPLAFANVVLLKGGSQIAGVTTDFDGKFTFPALTPGTYTVQATYVGYEKIQISDVVVTNGKLTIMKPIKASSGSENLDEFVKIAYEIPLIDPDQTSSGGTVTAEDIKKMPGRSAASIAATVGGVYSADDGGTGLSVRGARNSGTDTYIDGIKVRGTQNLPKSAIEQVSVITGGIPAQYGDATGGIVNITTRGASKEWFGGVEYLTSGFKTGDDVVGLDKFGYNLLGWSVSGPILTRKDSLGNKKDAIAGFFFSGEAKHEVDPRPFYDGDWKVNDGLMSELNETPYIQSLSEAGGVINSASYVTADDLETTPFRINASRKSLNLAGKIDLTTSKTTNVAIGGSFDMRNSNNYNRSFSLYNSDNNSQSTDRTWRVYGRFTQRFENSTDPDNPSLISDAYVTFQVDYSNFHSTTQSAKHKDQLSHYGYIGKFTTTRVQVYENVVDTALVRNAAGALTGDTLEGYFSNWATVLYEYEAGSLNPILSNYTSNYYDVFENDPTGNWDNRENLQNGGGLVNGSAPPAVYDLWSSMGTVSNGYSFTDLSQFRVSAQGSATIKDHSIKLGFEYEQTQDKFYSVSPVGLWGLGRQLTNTQIEQRSFEEGTFTEEIWIDSRPAYRLAQAYDADNHNTFDKNLRASLGMLENGTNWIDFDSYGPDVWNIGMFSPDELINGGGYVNNFGYDHTGQKLSGNASVDDFFTAKDDNGDYLRENPGFQPIYVAGFIQDKFAFEDLIFNVGLRVDRYDANQSVLKDKYSLFPVKTLGEINTGSELIPSNIGDDYVVYVSDASDPNADDIVGFRDGNVWYNRDGEEIADPSVLHSSGVPNPWLVDKSDNNVFADLDGESFKDYEPQVNISPRIAFSFPISDEALFFAHYDVLTQRPETGNRMDLISYLAFGAGGNNLYGNYFNNPDLKAEQTIDYELGFQQKLDNYSSLKISAFYREMRDQVQSVQVIGAFPGNYYTFDNEDFGTVKGMTVTYDLRTRGNISLRASYTLQFADGTGSSATASQNLVSNGNGNLRTLIPLSRDQRHRILVSADYRYGAGKNYNGPVLFGKDILQNVGLNAVMRSGSGNPYTKRSRSNGAGVLGTSQGASPQEGQLNASRLPFNTTVDLKLDKTIDIKWGKGEGEDRKEASLNVYIQTLNLLNARNILSVYSATGNASDDGFLAASYQQQYITNQIDETAFRDQYTVKAQNGFRYALPRRIRLGIQMNF